MRVREIKRVRALRVRKRWSKRQRDIMGDREGEIELEDREIE